MDEHSLSKGFATLRTVKSYSNKEGSKHPFCFWGESEDNITVGVVTPVSIVRKFLSGKWYLGWGC